MLCISREMSRDVFPPHPPTPFPNWLFKFPTALSPPEAAVALAASLAQRGAAVPQLRPHGGAVEPAQRGCRGSGAPGCGAVRAAGRPCFPRAQRRTRGCSCGPSAADTPHTPPDPAQVWPGSAAF
jgi:hypothetical protein